MVSRSLYAPVEHDLPIVEENLRSVSQVSSPFLSALLSHILQSGGKRLRPAITLLAGKLYNYRQDLLIPMATGVELLHTATLVHDDTVDNALTRRGRPTVNSRWSTATAVLLGDYIFARSADFVARTRNLRVIQLFAETLMTICEGELTQLEVSHDSRPTLEDYYRRIYCKTASLFATAAASGAILSGAPEPAIHLLHDYGRLLGMAYQVVDDILDFVGDESEMGKPVGNDLLQGTITIPALLLMERHPEDNPIIRILKGENREAHARRAIEMIRQSDVLDASYSVAADFCRQARNRLRSLPASPALDSLMAITEYIVQRKS